MKKLGPGHYEQRVDGYRIEVERAEYGYPGEKGWIMYLDGDVSSRTWDTKAEAHKAALASVEAKKAAGCAPGKPWR